MVDRTRRDFLRRFLKIGFGALGLLFGATILRFLYPAEIKRRSLSFQPVFREEDLPKRGVKKVNLSFQKDQKTLSTRVFLISHAGELYALSAVCTHLGCLVDWSRHKEQFLCPCHGGKYDIGGRVVEGPPRLALARLPLRVEEGMVSIGLRL